MVVGAAINGRSPRRARNRTTDVANDEDDFEELDWTTALRQEALRRAEDAKNSNTPRLGLDFGNVIVPQHDDGGFLRRNAGGAIEHCSKPCSGAREGVRALVRLFHSEHIFIVSKARSKGARRTLDWLKESGFLDDTGLFGGEDHVFFVSDRFDKRLVVDALGITHFVDDRMSVLRSLQRCEQRVLMCGPWVHHDDRHERGDRSNKPMVGKVVAQNWPEVVGAVRKWFKTRPPLVNGSSGCRGQGGSTVAAATGPSEVNSCRPSPAFEHCAWLESDSQNLRVQVAGLMEALWQAEANERRVDGHLRALECENNALLDRLAELELQVPPLTSATVSPEAAAAAVAAASAATSACIADPAAVNSSTNYATLLPPVPQSTALATTPTAGANWAPQTTRNPVCAPPSYPAPLTMAGAGEFSLAEARKDGHGNLRPPPVAPLPSSAQPLSSSPGPIPALPLSEAAGFPQWSMHLPR